MGQTTGSRAMPSSARGDAGYILDEDQIGSPFSRLFTDIQRFLERSQISKEDNEGERNHGGDQHRNALLRDMTALSEAIRHTFDSEAKVKRQLAASSDCMDKLVELVTKKNEAAEVDLAAIENQERQQLSLTKATAIALREAIRELKAAEANEADLCSKVVQRAQTVEALLRHSRSRRLQGLSNIPSEANMEAPTGQGAQQLQTLIKDVAALDKGLQQLQALQGEVKRLLATSQADLTTILQQGTRNHIAVQGEQESEQLRMAADNVGALEVAFYELKDAQILGAALADKVIKQVAATQSAMAVTASEGSKKLSVPEEDVAILKKAVRALLEVQTNSLALDIAVKEFTASAHAFLAAGREPTPSQVRASRRGGLELDLSDM